MRRLLFRVVGTVPGIRWLAFGIVVVALGCGILAHVVAREDFPTWGGAMWWSVQTVTTVGYGDITPKSTAGRSVAAVLMVAGVALISILTATISAGFVTRVQERRGRASEKQVLEALERIERRLGAIEGAAPASSAGDASGDAVTRAS